MNLFLWTEVSLMKTITVNGNFDLIVWFVVTNG